MAELKIRSLGSFALNVPLVKPEDLSFGRVERVEYVITRIEAGEFIGYGEAATLQGPTWSEESQETIKSTIDRYLSKTVQNADTLDYVRISRLMDDRVKGNNFAKAAIEMAILDAACKELNIPVYRLLGAKCRESIPLSWTLANNDVESDVREAKEYVKKGWRILKIKAGSLPVSSDMERVQSVRNAVGDSVSLRVDANQGWSINQAMTSLKALEDARVDLLEQPLPKWDLDGLAEVSRRTSIPIMADESLCSIRDAVSLIEKRAASVFSYKLTKMGGILNCRTVESIADAYRIGGYVGCMIETSIGTAGYLQFAASMHHLDYGCELFGPLRLEYDPARKGIEYREGEVLVPDQPGIGIEVDEERLRKLSTKQSRT